MTARGTMAGLFTYRPERPVGESARPETLTAIKRAAERYGIPAELTGMPPLRDGFWVWLRDRRGS